MDKVFIKRLKVKTIIGVNQWERKLKRTLYVDLTFFWDNQAAGKSDAIELALDYAKITNKVTSFAERSRFELLEAFAEQLVKILSKEFHIPEIHLRLTKPGAIANDSLVGIEIRRKYT